MQSYQDAKQPSWFRRRPILAGTVGCTALFITISLILSAVAVIFVILPVRFVGKSMQPTLNDGDRIIFDKRFGKLERGDIIVFHYPPDPSTSYIKRIIGLPGETIEMREGKVFINGGAIDEPYLKPDLLSLDTMPLVKIPDQHYFVMGDNRRNSSDSRYWGTVPRNLIYGKFIARY